jgi:hypothetical protein
VPMMTAARSGSWAAKTPGCMALPSQIDFPG